ncbi:hypothetical protein [Nocardia sp. NPDC051981]
MDFTPTEAQRDLARLTGEVCVALGGATDHPRALGAAMAAAL